MAPKFAKDLSKNPFRNVLVAPFFEKCGTHNMILTHSKRSRQSFYRSFSLLFTLLFIDQKHASIDVYVSMVICLTFTCVNALKEIIQVRRVDFTTKAKRTVGVLQVLLEKEYCADRGEYGHKLETLIKKFPVQ